MRMRIQAHEVPLPPMTTAATFQQEWHKECALAMSFLRELAADPKSVARAADVADIMIDRGLAALNLAETNTLRRHASIGALRFANLKRGRFPEVKEHILAAFSDKPPPKVRGWLESIEESIMMHRN